MVARNGRATVTTAKIATLEEILAKDDRPVEELFVPEWDTTIRVQALTHGQQYEVNERSRVEGKIDPTLLDLNLLIEGVVEPKFTAEHIGELRTKSAPAINRIVNRLYRLNRGTREQAKQAEKTFRD